MFFQGFEALLASAGPMKYALFQKSVFSLPRIILESFFDAFWGFWAPQIGVNQLWGALLNRSEFWSIFGPHFFDFLVIFGFPRGSQGIPRDPRVPAGGPSEPIVDPGDPREPPEASCIYFMIINLSWFSRQKSWFSRCHEIWHWSSGDIREPSRISLVSPRCSLKPPRSILWSSFFHDFHVLGQNGSVSQ